MIVPRAVNVGNGTMEECVRSVLCVVRLENNLEVEVTTSCLPGNICFEKDEE